MSLRHVVIAHSTVSTEASLSGLAAQCTIGLSALARQITHAALGTVVTGVGAAGETPVDIGRWYPVLEGSIGMSWPDAVMITARCELHYDTTLDMRHIPLHSHADNFSTIVPTPFLESLPLLDFPPLLLFSPLL